MFIVTDYAALSPVKKSDLWMYKNRRGADDFPEDILLYLEKESNSNAILGPFNENPFQSGLKISPLNSVPKKRIPLKEEEF